MIETNRHDLDAAFYGIVRLVAGWQDWKTVEELPNPDKLPTLLNSTLDSFRTLSEDPLNADPKVQNQVTRKLKAYQQLQLLEKFCFTEVIWDD